MTVNRDLYNIIYKCICVLIQYVQAVATYIIRNQLDIAFSFDSLD